MCFVYAVTIAVFLLFAGEAAALKIESPAFESKAEIPKKYTCDGENLSPPLKWNNPPAGTQSFALISDDPDVTIGSWVHWVAYNLSSDTQELQEGLPKNETLENGIVQGMTDFRRVGYEGPCPPPGKAHRYYFKLYALNTALTLPPKATKADILLAMNGHVLAQAELVDLYQRS